jgi:DNA segregation ATPase FtsK/SpoIIIE-like protein
MDDRYRELEVLGRRHITRDDHLPWHLLICDELAFFTANENAKEKKTFSDLFRDIIARGRAAGILVVAATQKPSVDVVPSAIRDLFPYKLALRSNTPQASDTILGQGWASTGADASTIPPANAASATSTQKARARSA